MGPFPVPSRVSTCIVHLQVPTDLESNTYKWPLWIFVTDEGATESATESN